jgi:hypothetical protein
MAGRVRYIRPMWRVLFNDQRPPAGGACTLTAGEMSCRNYALSIRTLRT